MGEVVELIQSASREIRPNRQSHHSVQAMFDSACKMDITEEMFSNLNANPKFADILRDLDIAEEDMFNLFETLDADGSGSIDLEELTDGIAKLRGGARRSDIIAVNFMLRSVQQENQEFFSTILQALKGRDPDMMRMSSLRSVQSKASTT